MPRPWAAPTRSHNFGIDHRRRRPADGPSLFNNHAGALFNSGSVRAGRLRDERGHHRAGRSGRCRADAARATSSCRRRPAPLRWMSTGGDVRPDRCLRHRPACRHGGCERHLPAGHRGDALHDSDGARRRYGQRPQPVGQPGLACHAFVSRSHDRGTRHRRRFHDAAVSIATRRRSPNNLNSAFARRQRRA